MPTKKNGYRPPVCYNEKLRYVEIDCGYCHECLQKKGREWRIRNYEQLKETPTAVFFTGTFTDERIQQLSDKYDIDKNEVNEIATKEVRLFMERIRKYNNGKSVKHWIVTEKGHTNTRRIHIHGIFYAENGHTKQSLTWLLKKQWIAGYSYNGKYVNERTINYVSKYLTKKDNDNKEFKGKILASPGLGKRYTEEMKERHKWQGKQTIVNYMTKQGTYLALPRYYKTKLFDEDQREQLWIWNEEEGIKYVNGFKIIVRTEEDMNYYNKLKEQRRIEVESMYGDSINELLMKRSANRIKNRVKYHEEIIKLKHKEIKQRIKADNDLCRDIEEYKRVYRGEMYRITNEQWLN